MPTDNIYSYCADYSGMNGCMSAIQQLYDRGELSGYPQLLQMIAELDQDAIKRLYARTVILYATLKNIDVGQLTIGGDFDIDFSTIDFSVGLFSEYTENQFADSFRKITNIFREFCLEPAITDEQRIYLDEGLAPVLELFDSLRDFLDTLGFNPCGASPAMIYRNNSPLIHIQAAGSTGVDGTAAGIHLRWALDGDMGENHIPQGAYLNDSTNLTGYRKKNDFVRVYRTPYTNQQPVVLNFEQRSPVIDSGGFQWIYLINTVNENREQKSRIRLVFKNEEKYNSLSASIDPYGDPYGFLTAYDGVVELESIAKNFFSANLEFIKSDGLSSATLRLEFLGNVKKEGIAEEVPVIRKSLVMTDGDIATTATVGDNLSKIRFSKPPGSAIRSIAIETYHDFLASRGEGDWQEVGNGFALSLENQEVFRRLEWIGVYDIDKKWPLYNEGTTVRVANYQDKWDVSRPYDRSLKEVVLRYLELSATDPRAVEVINTVDDPDAPGLEISFLDAINIMAVDYHIARMLGMGHIDTLPAGNDGKWLYRVSYTNRKSKNWAELVDHEYLSIPTGMEDFRLPVVPSLRPIKYSLGADEENNSEMFDAQGYSKVDRVRVVSIGRKPLEQELLQDDFWSSQIENWNMFEDTYPVLYGIEYRSDDQTSYVKPEITADDSGDYVYYAYDEDSPSGVIPECIPVPDNKDTLFTHFEEEEGIHHYAAYSINIFSRASSISDEVSTDETDFPVRNKLAPPTDIAIQYVQEEETLLFTTSTEQDWLANRSALFPHLDAYFTRISFNWLDIIDISEFTDISTLPLEDIIKADRIKVYFKPDDVFEVNGAIVNVSTVAGSEGEAWVELGGYTLINGQQQLPMIPAERFAGFQGSWLSTASGQFEILWLEQINGKLLLRIKKQSIIQSAETEQANSFDNEMRMVMPVYGERFSFTENMALSSQWENIVNKIDLVDFSDKTQPVIETTVDEEGNQTHHLIGGILGSAVISMLNNPNDPLDELPGYYSVRFDVGTLLPPHPQTNLPYDPSNPSANNPAVLEGPHVEWYKGQLLVPYAENSSKKKLVQVLRIVSLDPLELIVYDPVDRQDPDAILISETPNDLLAVNFHPGYKVYLFTEPEPAKFNWAYLQPEATKNDRKVLLALQSEDATYTSRISMPSVFMVGRVAKPAELEEIVPPWLRVRPDGNGRAAFTFDRKILPENGLERQPFGLMFFRISSLEVLEALYAPDTIELITEKLKQLKDDPYADQRFHELVNLIYDPENPGHFKIFEAVPFNYGFPDPDKPGLVLPGDNELKKLEKYRAALRAELLPLTEQPPIFMFIREGLHTENTEPTIRDLYGNLLPETDPRFNPFPMVRKFKTSEDPDVTFVRFTDYSLRGSSRFQYFYTAAEITNQLIIGPLSPYTGPVWVLDTTSDLAPNILNYGQLMSPEKGVRFVMAPLPEDKSVSKVRIYRSEIRQSMETISETSDFVEVDVGDNEDGSRWITDGLLGVKLGKTVHFRLATVRKIINEFHEEEEVMSKLSEIISIDLIDTLNPEAPELAYLSQEGKVTWLPTIDLGSYYLFKQNARGNWQGLATFENNDGPMEYPVGTLPTIDDEGNRIYHRFKVKVQNSSGLFNLSEKELTI